MTLESNHSPQSAASPDQDPAAQAPEDAAKAALRRLNNAEKKRQVDDAMASGQYFFERGRYKNAIADF